MSSLAHELAEQELASAAFAAASEEDASAAFAAAFDTSAAFAAASEEDASASASASIYFDASAAFAVASEEDASAAFAAAFDASAAFAAASEEDARASASASVYFDASAAFAFAAAFLDKEAADAYEAHCRILAKIRQCAKWKASLQARNLRLEMLPGQSPARAGACRRVQARVQEHIVQAKEQGEKLLALEASAKAEALSLLLERRERAGEETRLAVEDDLDDSDGELCFEDPRQATWAGPPQDLREVTKDEAGTALRSLVRAAAGPELKFWAGVETTAGELAAVATSGAGLAKKQFKVFDPGGGLELAAATTSGAGLAKMQSKVFDPGGEM
jgi:hypothetical protein